jgi:2-methylcitrate dehydratase PrpD
MTSAESATKTIADYALDVRSLPDTVTHEGLRSFVNIVGCTIGGSRHAAVETTWTALKPFAGSPQCTLLGRATKTDALTAALLNTLASSIYTYDDTHARAIVHPAGPIMGGVLAIADRQAVTGAQMLTAFILGIEVACRLSMAVSVTPAKGNMAWSQTGICCGIATAVAASRLLGLSSEATRQAIGIAASQAAGIRAVHGTTCTAGMPAHSSQVGLRAAYLAQAGFTSSQTALEAKFGFANCFAVAPDLSLLTNGLGSTFESLSNTYKPYPCGIVIHPMIDAILALRAAHGLKADDVEAVTVKAAPAALALCDRPSPKDEFEGQVSLHHWISAALILGRAGVRECEDAAIKDPALSAFRARVSATIDPQMPVDGADVTVVLKNGRTLVEKVRDCIGSKGRPMTDEQLDAKFMAQSDGVLPADRAAALLAQCWTLAEVKDTASLLQNAA